MISSANVNSILQQIAALNAAERAELRARLEKPSANGVQETLSLMEPTAGGSEPKDEAAFRWINAHGNAYPGEWLALDGDRLLAHGINLAEVAAAARAAGVQFPLLHLVEPPREHPYIHD